MKHFNIAIDGPAGAGKSTIARRAAGQLGFVYVDTGAMYRAMALYFLRKGINPADEEAVSRACGQAEVSIRYQDGAQQVLLNGEDVSGRIRTEEVGKTASVVSAYMPVREKLTELQKELAARENVIMDGRDIGTCVLPQAPAKIYLTASVEFQGAYGKGRGLRSGGDKEGHRGPGLEGHASGTCAFKTGGGRGGGGQLPDDH